MKIGIVRAVAGMMTGGVYFLLWRLVLLHRTLPGDRGVMFNPDEPVDLPGLIKFLEENGITRIDEQV